MKKKNRTAVVSGALGYIGRHVVDLLSREGWDLILVVRSSTETHRLPTQYPFVLCQYDGSEASLEPIGPHTDKSTVFFHLASSGPVDEKTFDCTGKIIESNITFGLHILSFMARQGLKNFVVAESYWQFNDSGETVGNSLYATSKTAFSLFLDYFCARGLRSFALVLYDVYGPCDVRPKLLNTLVLAAERNNCIQLTPGEQIIDYVYVDDVARAFVTAGKLLVADKGSIGFLIRHTVRSLEARTLKDYVSIMDHLLDGKLSQLLQWGARPYPRHQIMRPWLPSASTQLPEWTPLISFAEGVRRVLETPFHDY